MSRKKHIDTRNLVVCNTFDEFTNKLEQIDPNVEDIAGYITSLSQVIYGLTVESLWGTLGFTWDSTSILEGVPYNEERIEHIEADGENIDYSQKDVAWKIAHAVTKGYGHFNATTIPFTLIPSIPDGYRITEFRNTFNLIESEYIEVQKSDWSNLVDINNLAPIGKSISIDITGANLNSNNKTILGNVSLPNGTVAWKAIVYIKGDLSSCTNGIFENGNYWHKNHTVLLDDDNKDLNIPLSLKSGNVYYYSNKEEKFDISDWIYKNTDSPDGFQLNLYAASGKYYIDNSFANTMWNGVNSALRVLQYASLGVAPQDFVQATAIVDPIAKEIEPLSIEIDCLEDGNVREDRLFNLTIGAGNFNIVLDYVDGIRPYYVYSYDTQVFNPIKYIGAPTSITMWNPFCLVKDDNSWPTYNQTMIDKLTRFDGSTEYIPGTNTNGINQGYFMYGAYLYISKPSPYTIDCTNIRYLNLFERAHFIINDYSQFEIVETNTKVLELVKLINTNNLISFSVFANTVTDFYIKLPSIRTIFFCFDTYTLGSNKRFYIPEGCKVEAAAFPMMWYTRILFGKSSAKAFKLRYIDCRNYGLPYSAYLNTDSYIPVVNDNIYDYIELEGGIASDTDFLKSCCANTVSGFFGNNRIIRHPFIVVNTNWEVNGHATNWSIESSFVFIYKANITISHNTFVYTQEQITAAYNAFEHILPGIQVNDTGQVYTIKLKKSVYDLLTTAEKNHIINDLNYQLSYDL